MTSEAEPTAVAAPAPTAQRPRTPLSSVLPPLIFGTATFNYQYNPDPYQLSTTELVHSALSHGIRAFDTSPYYGPAEEILGQALATPFVRANFPRHEHFLITKCGRISSDEFDFSAASVRASVQRSLRRLNTPYLDLVYCHDVEFVSEEEVMEGVAELRRLRDEGIVRYVGISGYPLPVLAGLARKVLSDTGESLDAVMSYANFTLQNTLLASSGIAELKSAGVDVVPNASPLGMGLLRRDGVPIGSMGNWHPSSNGLRAAVRRASDFCDRHDEKLEVVAIRYALESWLREGAAVGSRGDPASGVAWQRESNEEVGGGNRLGVSVMGVSKISELEKTMQVWRSILDGLSDGAETARKAGRWKRDHEWSLNRQRAVQILTDGIREHLDEYVDYVWESPPKGFVNKRAKVDGRSAKGDERAENALFTPEASPQPGDASLPLR